MTPSVLTSTCLQSIFDDRTQTLRLIWDDEFRSWAEKERTKLLRKSQVSNPDRTFQDLKSDTDAFRFLGEFPDFPGEPAFFQNEVPSNAVAEILNIGFDVRLVKSNASGCSVNQVRDEHYEIQHPDRPMNVGLARMIAHEAGHVRFDSRFKPKNTKALIQSEVWALRTERQFLSQILNTHEMQTYLEYQKGWLTINRFAARCETIELVLGHCRGRPKKLWALEWASSRVGFSELLVLATEIVFPELKGTNV